MHEIFAKAFRLPENKLRLTQLGINIGKANNSSSGGEFDKAQAYNAKIKRIAGAFTDHLVKQAVAAHSKNPGKTRLDLNAVRKIFSTLENNVKQAGLKKPRDVTSEEILRRRIMDAVVTAHLAA
ncbi:hypothetical protein HY993_01635, partial [Candidatus Micrarchaeota archaeon]|nr:hypothetical protein [Candidatus Micrarchaeota archaeon]